MINNTIKSLSLSNNELVNSSNKEHFIEFFKSLKINNSLIYLGLAQTGIDEDIG